MGGSRLSASPPDEWAGSTCRYAPPLSLRDEVTFELPPIEQGVCHDVALPMS